MSAAVAVFDPAHLSLLCPISMEICEDPVWADDGNVYERSAIQAWFRYQENLGQHVSSPLTREPMSKKLEDAPELKRRAEAVRIAMSDGELPLLGVTSPVFDTLDRVRQLDLMKLAGVRPPVLVVLGNEKSGKSTTLERIVGFPVLPRAKHICTRMPIRVSLRRGEAGPATVSLYTRGQGLAKELVQGSKAVLPLEGLCDQVKTMMEAEVVRCGGIAGDPRGPVIVTDRELVVEIRGRQVPNLDLLDLPGLVSDNSAGLATGVQALIDSVIAEEGEFATYLVIVDARQAVNVSLAIATVQQHELTKRTLGVLTFLDQVCDPDDRYNETLTAEFISEKLLGAAHGHVELVAEGWCGVANGADVKAVNAHVGPHRELLRLRLISQRELVELQRWSQNGLVRNASNRIGIEVVQERVRAHFEAFIAKHWTRAMLRRMRIHLKDTLKKHWVLGAPVPTDEAYGRSVQRLQAADAAAKALGYQITDHPLRRVVRLSSDEEMVMVVLTRIAAVLRRKGQPHDPNADWLQTERTFREVRAMVSALNERPDSQRKLWGTKPRGQVAASTLATTELQWYTTRFDELVKQLGNLASGNRLSNLFIEALFSQPECRASIREEQVLVGHTDGVWKASVSRDGNRIASASLDKTVRLWDVRTGTALHTLCGHREPVFSALFSRDGARVASASYDKTVKLWNADTGALLHTLVGHTDTVRSACFSHDGTRIVTASEDNTVGVWETRTGLRLHTLTGHRMDVTSAVFNRLGSRIVSASADRTVRIWHAEGTAGALLTLTGHTGVVFSAVFSGDGTRIVSASADRTVRLWDASVGSTLHTLSGHCGAVTSAAFNRPATRILSTDANSTACVWDTDTGALLYTVSGYAFHVWSTAFSWDGRRVVSTGSDYSVRLLRLKYSTPVGEATSRAETDSHVDDTLVKPGRLTALREHLTQRVQEYFSDAAAAFVAAAAGTKSLALDPRRCLVIPQRVSLNTATLKYDDTHVASIGDIVMKHFLEHIVAPLPAFIAALTVPHSALAEACLAERGRLLREAADAAEVMVELRALAVKHTAGSSS
jgi:WD40 repeat protein